MSESRRYEILTDLYVYYLQGRLKTLNEPVGASFIGNWEEDDFSFLFFSNPSRDEVNKLISIQPQLALLDEFQISYEDWQGGKIKPFKIGRFFFTPPWEKADLSEENLNIILDPGVVFGAGTHPTTNDCLNLIDWVCDMESIESGIDLGTGTGILALAAARRGCQIVLAVDFNFLAAKTAKKNVVLNGLDNRIMVIQGKAQDYIEPYADLLIANIHYDVMEHLIRSKGFLRKKWFILSGLLRTQAADISDRLSHLPVKILEKKEHDGIWHTFLGKILRNV